MRSKHDLRWIAVTASLLTGCTVARQYPSPPPWSSEEVVEVGCRRPDIGLASDNFASRAAIPAVRNVLVLSGGGMNGAYTAGVLKGWSESGSRPRFDAVTGISTGALVAPYALLGPQYDAEVERLYTSIRQDNVFRPRLIWLDSLASSKPLEQCIAGCATDEVLRQIAKAHRHGRRLYVGTTNLDTKRLVVWDMGAIAARNSAESSSLFQKILLASCSVPGLLPPVSIDVDIDGKRYTELHVDGSVAASLFLPPNAIGIGSTATIRPDGRPLAIHVIVAGKLQQVAAPTERRLISIAGESLNAVLQAKTEDELTRLFILARYVNAEFKVTGIPDAFPTSSDSMSFDPLVMRGLFDAGYRGGKEETAWRSIPPGIEKEWLSVARTGTMFATTGKARVPESSRPSDLRIPLAAKNAPGANY